MKFLGTRSTTLALSLLLTVGTIPPLHSQTTSPTPADANATALPSRADQAPDEATKKITDLVLAGKYPEAQKLTEGLLIAYPNDQRLIKAKALIDSRLSEGSSTGTAPGNAEPTQPAANPNAEQLTGMDKIDYDTLILLARQARQATDLDGQKKLLQQFMDQSSAFLQKHPDEVLIWQLRAASALGLDDPAAGYEAGQKLLSAGAADSNDPSLQQLLAQLNKKGWLDKEKNQALEREKLKATWTNPATGNIWTKQDSGSDVGWNQAKDYCGSLRLAGYATWQLPTTEELGAIHDKVIKGDIKLTGKAALAWGIPITGEPCFVIFNQPGAGWAQHCANAINRSFVRALCIRRPAQ
jgi:hypothetical protein